MYGQIKHKLILLKPSRPVQQMDALTKRERVLLRREKRLNTVCSSIQTGHDSVVADARVRNMHEKSIHAMSVAVPLASLLANIYTIHHLNTSDEPLCPFDEVYGQ